MQTPTSPNRLQNPLLGEKLHLFSDVAGVYRNSAGRKLHVSTLNRWRDAGIAGVRLEAIRFGGRWMTSIESIDRFITAISVARQSNTNSKAAFKTPKVSSVVQRELTVEGL